MARAVLNAYVRPSTPEQEDTFNRWYDDVHIPQVLERIPGVVAARRYRLSPVQLVQSDELPKLQYLTVYELDTDDLRALADRLVEALEDGTLDPSDAVDLTEPGPLLYFYEPADQPSRGLPAATAS